MDENKAKAGKAAKRNVYFLTAAVLIVLVIVMFFTVEEPHKKTTAKDVVGALSNCFLVPGAVIGGIGGLSLIAKCGGYDGITYAFKNFGLHNIFFSNPKQKRTQSFYDYKKEKDEKGRTWLPSFLYVGLGGVAVSVLLLIVYCIL